MKKFELTTDFITVFGVKMFRIRASVAFGNVKEGELGGYVEKEENLDQEGDAWVSGDARVYGDAWVSGDADYAGVKGFGTECRHTTFFRCKDGQVRVKCGCFYGTIPEFRKQVKDTRDGKIAKEYMMIADLMEYHFSEETDTQERTDEA